MDKKVEVRKEITKRSSDGRETPSLLDKKTAVRQEKTKIQLRNAKNPLSFINFNGELAKSAHHPSEITKRSPVDRETPSLLDIKAAIRKEKTKIQLRNAKNPQVF
ncbi:MAG: hypothetical protein ACI4D7_07730, partial [Lachnospiraceae bacterium]